MTEGVVVIYLSRSDRPLRRVHQRILLEDDAKAIAMLKQYEFGGYYQSRNRPAVPVCRSGTFHLYVARGLRGLGMALRPLFCFPSVSARV
jgi:hypothetical protein